MVHTCVSSSRGIATNDQSGTKRDNKKSLIRLGFPKEQILLNGAVTDVGKELMDPVP